jgi:hypothetical protein
MSKISFPSYLRHIFSPPYTVAPVAVALYVLILCFFYTANGPFTGHLVGFDDHVRMVQVLNLVNGGDWFDRTLTRVNAPEGFDSIWARIVDIPIAFTIILSELFVDQKTAALASTVIIPLVELIILFHATRYMARPLVGKKESWLVVLFVGLTSILNQQTYTFAGFHFGEASHHSWYVILNVLMNGAIVRMAMGVPDRRNDYILSLSIALFLAVGIEGFPLIAGGAALLGILSWAFSRPQLAKRAARAMAMGTIYALLLLPLHRPPAHLFDILFSQFSLLGPILISSAAIFLVCEYYVLQKFAARKILSLILLSFIALAIGGILIACFPRILDGAGAALSPTERKLAMTEHPEAWTMWRATMTTWQFIGLTIPMALTILASLYAGLAATNRRQKLNCFAFLGLSIVDCGMAHLFWRYIHHAMLIICPWLLWLWQKLRRRLPNNKWKIFSATIGYIVLGPLWLVILPASDQPLDFWPQVLAYPAKTYLTPYRCDMLNFAEYLDSHYTADTKINVIDSQSAYFLYYTKLKVDFLANFPSHDKFIDNRRFFAVPNENISRDIARQHGFDLVAVCKVSPMAIQDYLSRPYRQPTMNERLIESIPPTWLKPVPMDIQTDYLLYEVDHKSLAGDTK